MAISFRLLRKLQLDRIVCVMLPPPLFATLWACVGYSAYKATSAPATGSPNRVDKLVKMVWPSFPGFSLKLQVGRSWHLHIHHWLYLLVLGTLLFLFAERTPIARAAIYGCVGGAAQGIHCYPEDWHRVVVFEPRDRAHLQRR